MFVERPSYGIWFFTRSQYDRVYPFAKVCDMANCLVALAIKLFLHGKSPALKQRPRHLERPYKGSNHSRLIAIWAMDKDPGPRVLRGGCSPVELSGMDSTIVSRLDHAYNSLPAADRRRRNK